MDDGRSDQNICKQNKFPQEPLQFDKKRRQLFLQSAKLSAIGEKLAAESAEHRHQKSSTFSTIFYTN